ncbi:MAG: sugar ABC transporter permease, partial [Caldilineaceae bacterium]|nr:sugar ABC transporter permease [Caldilineaceae bacterium]
MPVASTRNPSTDIQLPRRPLLEWPGYLVYRLFALLMNGVELVMNPLQQWLGVQKMGYIFVLPNLLIFGIFVLFPMLLNFYYAFTGGTELCPQDRTFVGAQNFARLFDCTSYLNPDSCREDLFWRGIYNTGFFVLFQVGGMVFFALVTALVLNRAVVGRGFFRGIFFYPVLLSPVVVALIWKWILLRDGVLNAALVSVGLDKILFFVDPTWAMFWAIFVSVWAHMGFYTLILLAGLQAIPPDLYEAAEMDGTSRERVFWRITLPLLWPNMLVVIVLALIKAVQIFDEVFVLTGGGPG